MRVKLFGLTMLGLVVALSASSAHAQAPTEPTLFAELLGKYAPLIPLITGTLSVIIVCVIGACGGYLSAKEAKPLVFFEGAAGAIIILTLVPVDRSVTDHLFTAAEDTQNFLKLIALGLVGGYGGRSLLESSVSHFAKSLSDLREETKGLKEQADDLAIETKRLEEQSDRNVKAINLVELTLRGLDTNVNELKSMLREATSFARYQAAYRADENRRQNWEKSKDVMERSMPVFLALIELEEAEECHWWHASLGYCLKDKSDPDYSKALAHLNRAIEIRSEPTRSGAYEFNRAICCIHLAAGLTDERKVEALDQQINSDLRRAQDFPRFNEIIKTDLDVQRWLRRQAEGGKRPYLTDA